MSDRDAYPPPPEPLGAPTADSHTHLDMSRTDGPPPDPADAIAAARAVGVTTLVQIGCDVERAHWSAALAARHPDVWAGVALHPNEAPRLAAHGGDRLERAYAEIDRLAALPQVVAVGETGLDHYRTGEDGRAAQEDSFRRHIAMAKEHGKTLVIHDRDAHDDVLRVLAEEGAPDRVVMHCFSGDAAMARTCVERGYWLSYAGTVTFANAAELRNALAVTPAERVLVETDSPFLTPMPFRGRPNASYLIPTTIRAMAAVRRIDPDELAAQVMSNTREAFAIPSATSEVVPPEHP